MKNNLKIFLWLLKFGAIINLYFFLQTLKEPLIFIDSYVLVLAQILFIVSGFRCLFPNNYRNNAVLHDSFLSSIFLTRFLATFSEIAYITFFAYLIRLLNFNEVLWINVLSWLMVFQVIISQFFVWTAILIKRVKFYFYEEFGWAIIFIFNTITSIYLYMTIDNLSDKEILIESNILFGIFYLPWQYFHLRSIWKDQIKDQSLNNFNLNMICEGLYLSIYKRYKTTKYAEWGGIIGVSWMAGYWICIIPVWVYFILQKL